MDRRSWVCLPDARAASRRRGRMLLLSSTTSFVGDIGEAGAGPSELDVRAMTLQAFEVLDHGCGGLPLCGN